MIGWRKAERANDIGRFTRGMAPLAICLFIFASFIFASKATAQTPPLFPPQIEPPVIPQLITPTSTEIPPPTRPSERELIIENADDFFSEGDQHRIEGNVLLRWTDYLLKADKVLGNSRTQQFTFTGNVAITGGGQTTTGDEMFIDLRSQQWRFLRGVSVVTPALLRGNLLSELYIKGDQIEGSRNRVITQSANATTCSNSAPDFLLVSKSLDFWADHRLILRHTELKIKDRTILTLPYIVVPLEGARYRGILPDIGKSVDEGFYAKSAFGYVLAPRSYGNMRLDLMEKKGVGLGFDHQYKFSNANGTASVYFLANQVSGGQDLTAYWNNSQKIGSLLLNFRTDYRQNIYNQFPTNTTWNNTINLTLPQGGNTTRLVARTFQNNSTNFNSDNNTVTLTDTRRFGRNFRWNLDLSYQDSSSESSYFSTKRSEVDTRALLSYNQRVFDADLNVTKFTPIGSNAGFFAGLERIPELTLRSDAQRLFGERFVRKWLPFSIGMGFGQFSESSSDVQTERYNFEWQSSSYSNRDQGLGLSYNTAFKQSVYGNGTAQYQLQGDFESRYYWSKNSGVSVRYNYLRPYGFTPFFFDRSGTYNLLYASLDTQIVRGLTLQIQTGYDFLAADNQSDPYQLTSINAVWQPAKWFRARSTANFDPNTERFTNASFDLAWLTGATRVSLAARYNPQLEKLSSAYLVVDALKWGRLHVQSALRYDGFLEAFTSQQYMFTYDLHCIELIGRYIDNPFGFRRDRDITFFIRVKAFPIFNRFGFGQQGDAIGYGMSDQF
jgi:LPS-assembly protein